jgi:tetratricopeptide (TPR) repeat protein
MALYDAFISYSHAKDKPIAAALQSVVQKLGKPWYRRRALRVFRDDTSLSATPSLWPTIEQALGQSRFLIMLASPEAAASPWVSKEVAYWLDHKGADTLLIAVTDGELGWDGTLGDFAWRDGMPLPPVVKGRFGSEPKWVDLRAYRDGADKRDAKFTELAADFAAAIHGMPKEDLLSQEVRQQRRALTLAWSAAGSLLILAGLAGWQWKTAVDAERLALEQRNRAVVAEATATEQKDIAQTQRDLAVRNFGIAKNAADHVVFRIAQDLRDVQGMRVESVRRILDAAQAMMDELARAAPDDLPLQRSRAAMLIEFVVTYLGTGDLTRARTAAEESLAIVRKLAAADPGNAGWQRDVSVGLDKVGDVRLDAGDRAGALAAYEESLAVMRKLAAADSAGWQRDVSVSLEKVGDVRLAAGDRAGALAAYEESLAIRRKLTAADPGNASWQRDVSVSLNKVGDVRVAAGDRAGALAAYEESLAIVRKLAAADPGNAGWQRDVSVSLNKVGDVRVAAGDRAGALAVYEESLAIRRKLAAADPGNAGWQTDVVISLYKVSTVADAPRARAALREALAILEVLAREDKLTAAQQNWPQLLRDALAKLPREEEGAR